MRRHYRHLAEKSRTMLHILSPQGSISILHSSGTRNRSFPTHPLLNISTQTLCLVCIIIILFFITHFIYYNSILLSFNSHTMYACMLLTIFISFIIYISLPYILHIKTKGCKIIPYKLVCMYVYHKIYPKQ